jgi:hypothetical protein
MQLLKRFENKLERKSIIVEDNTQNYLIGSRNTLASIQVYLHNIKSIDP